MGLELKELLFYEEYEQFYMMAKESVAFREFCRKAFGEDFSQDGFSDISQIDRILPYVPKDGQAHILDIGCGNGKVLGYIQKKTGAYIHGFDYSGKAIETARELFIDKANEVHKGKYDYSKVEYKNYSTKVCIICPEHGEWWVTPHNFFNGHVCPTCSGRQRRTKEVFIERAQKKHGNRYDYSKVDYKGAEIPVCIICPIHGEFWQNANSHLRGSGCPICYNNRRKNNKLKFRFSFIFSWLCYR